MPSRPAGPEHFVRVDWEKIVYALADYAYRSLAPDTTWTQARVMARAAISLVIAPDDDSWDPREETLLRHLGGTLRDMLFVVHDERGSGRFAREASPDWEAAKRTYTAEAMHKKMTGRAGLPMPKADFFRARRRLRDAAVQALRELPLPGGHRKAPYVSRDEEIMDALLSSTDQDNFESTMPRAMLEEFIRDLGGDPAALWKSVGPWIQQTLDERAKHFAQSGQGPMPGIGSA